jgi:SNF2 family DNA or RNA helicase
MHGSNPLQKSAQQLRKVGAQPGLNINHADDPGAGKTIMAGLLMKELIARGDLQRCLVVCPGSLAEQWQDELFRRFHILSLSSMNPFDAWAGPQSNANRADMRSLMFRPDSKSRSSDRNRRVSPPSLRTHSFREKSYRSSRSALGRVRVSRPPSSGCRDRSHS